MNQEPFSPDAFPFEKTGCGLRGEWALESGLWQLTLLARGTPHQWERLYVPLWRYGNDGVRTGPWDFSLDPERKGRPLLPAFWVFLNGRKLGLWFFQRPPVEDIPARLFRGRLAFLLPEAGPCELRLEPYDTAQTDGLEWLGGWLEPDAEDRWLARPGLPEAPRGEPLSTAWAGKAYWQERRNALRGGLARFHAPLEAAFEAVRKPIGRDYLRHADGRVVTKDVAGPNDLRLLFAAWKLTGEGNWRERLREEIVPYLEWAGWSAKAEDVYGYGGDYGVAHPFRVLAGLWMPLREALNPEEHAALGERLAEAGERFFHCALLMRDYWGGSILQDHGKRSIMAFATGALALYGKVEAAGRWLCWALPRVERMLSAVPREGIPPSSYQNLRLYTTELMAFREAWRAWTGEDLLAREPWRQVPDCLELARCHPEASPWQVDGGYPFLSALAEEYGDSRAQAWEDRFLADPEPVRTSRRLAIGILESFLVRSEREPVPAVAVSEQPLYWLRDGGWVVCRQPQTGWALVLHAGPQCGYHAFAHAPGPCDRLGGAPVEGHFQLACDGKLLFASPASPYKLHSGVGSILFIEGRGQVGDIGYPMSIPSWNGPWGEIRFAQWEEPTQRGRVVADLSRVYPPECGVLAYTREWVIGPEGLRITDRLALSHPARLEWRFQLAPEVEVECEGDEARLRLGALQTRFRMASAGLLTPWSTAATPQVRGYTSDHAEHRHLVQTAHAPSAGGVFEWTLK